MAGRGRVQDEGDATENRDQTRFELSLTPIPRRHPVTSRRAFQQLVQQLGT